MGFFTFGRNLSRQLLHLYNLLIKGIHKKVLSDTAELIITQHSAPHDAAFKLQAEPSTKLHYAYVAI